MKKILPAFLLMLTTTAALQSCQFEKGEPGPNTPAPSDSVSIKQLKGLVDFKTAEILAKNYAADNAKSFVHLDNAPTKTQDAKNIWFDIKQLKDFIVYIEQQAKLAKCAPDTKFGIRLYYGKYPSAEVMKENSYLSSLPADYANHHTIFFTPTYFDKASNKNVDFDPSALSEGCKLQPLQGSEPVVKAMGFFAPSAGGSSVIMNHGNIAPPPDGAGDFPTTDQ